MEVEKPQVGPGESSSAAGTRGGWGAHKDTLGREDCGQGLGYTPLPSTRNKGRPDGKGGREEISHIAELPLVSKQVQALRPADLREEIILALLSPTQGDKRLAP